MIEIPGHNITIYIVFHLGLVACGIISTGRLIQDRHQTHIGLMYESIPRSPNGNLRCLLGRELESASSYSATAAMKRCICVWTSQSFE